MYLWETSKPEYIKKVLQKVQTLEAEATKDKPLRIIAHADADGITSAVLTSLALKTKFIEVNIQSKFKDYSDEDIILDLGAPTEKFTGKGVIIDHHDHPDWDNSYDLLWDINGPTTRMVYNFFKDKIPDDQKWKAVIGIAGDGKPELIPDEIWDKYGRLLFTSIDTVEGQYYGKYTHWVAPIYSLMHTPINHISKVGNAYEAYVVLKKARTPFDIINHPMALAATKRIKTVLKSITSPKAPEDKLKMINFSRIPVIFAVINFDEPLVADVAYRIKEIHRHKTIVVVNPKVLTGSIRGDLAKYIANKLVKEGFEAGGHPGYCGITLRNENEVSELLETLYKICG